jgi:hypothetical protein
MQNLTKNKGLALGSIVAILSTTLFGALPASATDATNGAQIAIAPVAGPVDNLTGLVTQDFPIKAFLLPNVTSVDFGTGSVNWEITKTAGNLDLLVGSQSSQATSIGSDARPASFSTTVISSLSAVIPAARTTGSVIAANVASSTSILTVRAFTTSGVVSSSPNVTFTVKFWIDNGAGVAGVHDSFEWFTTKTVTLLSPNNVSATTTLTNLSVGDSWVTVSATVTGLNFQNVDGSFYLQMTSSLGVFVGADDKVTVSPFVSANQMVSRSGVVSFSFPVSGSVRAATSISAIVVMDADADLATTTDTFHLGAANVKIAANPAIGSLEVDVVSGNHATQSGAVATVRTNQTYTFRVGAISNSASLSGQAVSVRIASGVGLTLNVKHISINGAAATTSWPTQTAPLALTTGALGYADFTLTTTGFVDGNDFDVIAFVGNTSKTLNVEVEANSYSLEAEYSTYASAPGASTVINYDVTDQWGVAAPNTANLRLMLTRGGSGFSYTTTVSYEAVVGGAASFTFTPEPATRTGSATVGAVLQQLDSGSGAYTNISANVSATVNVTSTANGFGTGLRSSYSVSVSYQFPNTTSFVTVTAKGTNTGSAVVVSGTNMVFRVNGVTYSGTATVRVAGNLDYTFDVFSTRVGSSTLTLTTGTSTTTSLLIVSPASSDMGTRITWDTTAIDAGKTKVVTGTLTDRNGNPVDTTIDGRTAGDSGTASLVISYTGTAGIVVGTVPTETDADGKFRISVLTSAADSGTLTITAVYMPQGASTVAANRVTSVQAVTVAPAAAPEVNAVIGSFLGRWAVRVENAKGAVVSVKVGGNWFKYTSLNDNYLFSRKSRVGATIAVSVWVNGELQNSQTITVR